MHLLRSKNLHTAALKLTARVICGNFIGPIGDRADYDCQPLSLQPSVRVPAIRARPYKRTPRKIITSHADCSRGGSSYAVFRLSPTRPASQFLHSHRVRTDGMAQ